MADIEKVKQGLRCCAEIKSATDCESDGKLCPYLPEKFCLMGMCCDALDVIEQMEQEIARLKKTEAEKQEERKRKRQEYMKRYRSEHKEQANKYNREWRKNNPEKWKAQKARERERQKQKNAK